jgi:type IV pilus assembly protein PilQ
MRFNLRQEEKTLWINLQEDGSAVAGAEQSQHFAATGKQQGHAIRDIQFRRSKDGAGVVVVDLSSDESGVDIQQKGSKLQVSFRKTKLPDNLRRQLDVVDFATPVTAVTTVSKGEDVVMEIVPKGLWEHVAFQSENQFTVEVKPVKEDPNKLFQGTKAGYQGEPISLDFHSVPVYELLRVFADITNFNIIASDSVAAMGNVTLRMRDVPWDQALDLVLDMKHLAMKKNGSVVWIMPRDEMMKMEKEERTSRQEIDQLEPTRTESFQVNYQKAADIQKLLGDKDQPILSKSGSVVIDAYSNRLFVTDISSRLERVRDLINLIDVPTRQVMIEARVVEARDNYGRELGVRMNLFNSQPVTAASLSGNKVLFGGGVSTPAGLSTLGTTAQTSFAQNSTMGVLTFSLFNPSLTRVLNLELRAMEADGKGKSLSNPRVVTGNNIKALIEQGDEIPYVTPGFGTAPPTVTFKKAKLSLEVTPQITPDGRVKMKLVISKDKINRDIVVLGNPAIASAKVETEVLVENGGTLVIGGVTAEESSEAVDRIPVLGDLPYVGFLFKHKNTTQERKELLVFITPRIVDEKLSVR